MRCIYCDEEITANSVFCTKCGKEVQFVAPDTLLEDEYIDSLVGSNLSTEKKKKNASEPNKSKRYIRITFIITAILLFVVLIAAIVLIGKGGQGSSYNYQIGKGKAAMEAHDYESAIQYYEAAIEIKPDDIESRIILGDLYKKMNNEDGALITYLELIQLQPDNREAYEEVIKIYEKRGDTEAIFKLRESVTDEDLLQLFKAYDTGAPMFNYSGGEYQEFLEVTLHASEDSVIYYTLDRTDPIAYGKVYQGPISLHEMKKYTISAVALNQAGIYSEVVTNEYDIKIPAPQTPVVSPDGGEYMTETYVTIQIPEGCVAFYTWDGSDPNAMSAQYTDAFPIPSGNNVLSVILVDSMTGLSSDIYRQYFTYYP